MSQAGASDEPQGDAEDGRHRVVDVDHEDPVVDPDQSSAVTSEAGAAEETTSAAKEVAVAGPAAGPAAVTVTVHARPEYMGTYAKSSRVVQGAPLYVRRGGQPLEKLLLYAQQNKVAKIKRLLAKGHVRASAGNSVGQTALHVACLWGNTAVARCLIAHEVGRV